MVPKVVGGDGTVITRDQLAEDIEECILSGKYPVGSKLPSERQLTEQYRLSRPVIREALRTLSERRLVEIHPGRGTFVRHARSSDASSQMRVFFRRSKITARHLIKARSMLECSAAELAAEHASTEDLAYLRQTLVDLDAAPDVVEQARLDLSFHYGITRAARNPVIESMFASVAQPMVELMLRSLIDPAVSSEALALHATILIAIEARSADDAREAMARHLRVAERFYGDDLDQSVELVARRALARQSIPGLTLEDVLERAVPDGGFLIPAGQAPDAGRT